MGLTQERAQRHIKEWRQALRGYRKHWPDCLFHAAHVTTAVQILKSGEILSRRALGSIEHDVANQGALNNNKEPHGFVRLYFRPRTVFHLKTEGIKCIDDPYRQAHQMSIPILFAFDLEKILTLPSAGFSDGMLSVVREIGYTDDFFDAIPFDDVYHDSALDQSSMKRVQDCRMAEVVVPERLPLEPYLKWVICRTDLDRQTLVSMLGEDARKFKGKLVYEHIAGSFFLHRGLYIKKINFDGSALSMDFFAPHRLPVGGVYELLIEQWVNGRVLDRHEGTVPCAWPGVSVGTFKDVPNARWAVQLEDVLAFNAPVPSDRSILLP